METDEVRMYILLSAAAYEILLESCGDRLTATRSIDVAIQDAATALGLPKIAITIRLPEEVAAATFDVQIYLPAKGRPFTITQLPSTEPVQAIAMLANEALGDKRATSATFQLVIAGLKGQNPSQFIDSAIKIVEPLWLLDHAAHLLSSRRLAKVTSEALTHAPLPSDLARRLAESSEVVGDILTASPSHAMREIAAEHTWRLSRRAQAALALDFIGTTRRKLAERRDVHSKILLHLACDRSFEVREKALTHSNWHGPNNHERDFSRELRRRRLLLIAELSRLGKSLPEIFEPGVPHEEWAVSVLALVIAKLAANARLPYLLHAHQEPGMWLRAARPFTNLIDLEHTLMAMAPLTKSSPGRLATELSRLGHERKDSLWPEYRYLGFEQRFPKLARLRQRMTLSDYELDLARVAADLWIAGICLDNEFKCMSFCMASQGRNEALVILRHRSQIVAILGVDANGQLCWHKARRGKQLDASTLNLVQRLLDLELLKD